MEQKKKNNYNRLVILRLTEQAKKTEPLTSVFFACSITLTLAKIQRPSVTIWPHKHGTVLLPLSLIALLLLKQKNK